MSVVNGKTQLCLHVLAAATLLAMAPANTAEAADYRFADNPVDGQYIVVLKSDVAGLANENSNRPKVAAVASEMARTHRADLVRSYNHALRGFVVKASDNALARLLADKRVEYVEEDGFVKATATQSGATWGIDRTDQRDLPLSGSYTYDTNASTVHAYIVDTGILAGHVDFGGRVSGGFTAITDGNGTNDCNGHGTHVAGTVGSATWGIAKAVQLHPVRVLDCGGSGSNAGVIAGVDWVTANHVKPAVANMSLGGGASSALDTAVTNSINAGVTYAVAAGNDNADACNSSPARAAAALTAASSTSTDARSSFSNWGSCIDLFAPGSSITSTWFTSTTATNTISGTSMASPHIAGVAALYLAVNPTATASQVNSAVIAATTLNKITDVKGSPNRLLYSFFGSNPPPPPPPGNVLTKGVAVSSLSASTGNSLNFTMNVPAGSSNLTFVMSGGTGDADMYVKFGSAPTDTVYDCRPFLNGNNETCTFAVPSAGTYHVRLKAFSTFSGVSLIGNYSTGGGGQTYTNNSDFTINDNATVDSPITVSGRSGNAPSSTPVAINIVHTYIGDLKVDLVAPDGSLYNLHNRTGGSADNIVKTVNLNLSTEALNGTWKLRVNDNASADTGFINSWSITF